MHLFSRFACATALALVCSLAATQPAQAQELVTNGGLETGDFTGWTLGGNTGFTTVTDNNGFAGIANSGTYGAYFGAVGSETTLSQTLGTVPGGLYSVQFFLRNYSGDTPNSFAVSFDGVDLFSAANLPEFPYTQFNYTGTATGNSAVLQFRFRHDPSFFGLDDISVTPSASAVPEPGAVVAGTMLFGGLGIGMVRGRKRRLAI